ncbi:MAG: M20/M25/M40 family metallo-hydrolase [Rickettsiales bacterium]|jgi:endoglucanase|nr:M20/M25/M40 family metallo-hydrolase [Rickettsiales bacterium]
MNKKFLKELCETISPSGSEQQAAKCWMSEAKKITDDVWCDVMGSSHAVINKDAKIKVVLMGHYDELGFIIQNIDSEGFLTISGLGGWDTRIFMGQHVKIIGTDNKIIYGVVGQNAIHLMDMPERDKTPKFRDLFIDIGAKNKEDAEKLVSVGDIGVVDHKFTELQNNNFASRGLDDKTGAFVVLEVLRALSKQKINVCVEAVATAQEEVGAFGARVSAYASDAQIGIAVDVTHSSDYPTSKMKSRADIKLGGGAVITRGLPTHPKLFALLKKTAQEKNITHQFAASNSPFGTDAGQIAPSKSGVITALISTPNRYMHSPSEVCNWNDLQAEIDLIVETIAGIDEKTDFSFVD